MSACGQRRLVSAAGVAEQAECPGIWAEWQHHCWASWVPPHASLMATLATFFSPSSLLISFPSLLFFLFLWTFHPLLFCLLYDLWFVNLHERNQINANSEEKLICWTCRVLEF
jgi:hypothetical protein